MARHRYRPAQRREARARHPARLPAFRQTGRGHDGQRDHLSRPFRRARSGQGAGVRDHHAGAAQRAGAHLGMERSQRHHREAVPRSRARPAPSARAQIFRAVPHGAGPAAPPGPALRRHGDLPGTARFGSAAGAGHHARPRGGAVGQRRLRRYGDHQGGPAGPGHDGGDRRDPQADSRNLWRRGGPGAPAAGRSGRFRGAAERRYHRHVPGGEPRADVLAAAHDAAPFLRHGGAGGHHPARADRGQDGASVSEPAAGPGEAGLPASFARAGAAAHAGRSAVSGAVAEAWR